MSNWSAIARCISITETNTEQVIIGGVYHLKNRYTLQDGDEYCEVYKKVQGELEFVGRMLTSHFEVIASTNCITVEKSVHSSKAMVVVTYNLNESVKNFFKFLHIWGDQGVKNTDGTYQYEVACADFVKSKEFEDLMQSHGIKVTNKHREV